jgi:hypothetical protein
MAKFRIIERVACWVDFVHEVEADSAADARQEYIDNQQAPIESRIDESIAFLESTTTVEEV